MKTIIGLIILIFILPFAIAAQSKALVTGTQVTDAASSITWTPTADDNTYSIEKNYKVFKLWNENSPLSDKEKSDLANLKEQLSKRNIELITFKWKTEEDIKNLFKEHGIENVEVSTSNGLFIKTKNLTVHKSVHNKKTGEVKESNSSVFSSTDSNVILVFEGKFPLEAMSPVALCAGKTCETDFLKKYFKID